MNCITFTYFQTDFIFNFVFVLLLFFFSSLNQQQNQKSVNASSSHINAGSAENQQPQIGDSKHLQNLSKTGSFLSHLARELSGGRASSSTASDSPAMKSTSRNNSSGSNSGVAGKQQRMLRKQQQLSCSEGSVCEEAREIDDIQSNKSMANEPPAAAAAAAASATAATEPTTSASNSTNIETSNENDTKMVSDIPYIIIIKENKRKVKTMCFKKTLKLEKQE